MKLNSIRLHPMGQAVLLACGSLLAVVAAPAAHAATIAVNTTTDVLSGNDGICSLREAVIAINTAGATTGDCAVDTTEAYGTNDTITLPAGTYTLSLTGLDESFNDANSTSPSVVPTVVNTPDASTGDLDIQ